eukprot:scaffold82747_cov28-Tisochrysis_lutea.AAC.1
MTLRIFQRPKLSNGRTASGAQAGLCTASGKIKGCGRSFQPLDESDPRGPQRRGAQRTFPRTAGHDAPMWGRGGAPAAARGYSHERRLPGPHNRWCAVPLLHVSCRTGRPRA